LKYYCACSFCVRMLKPTPPQKIRNIKYTKPEPQPHACKEKGNKPLEKRVTSDENGC